MSLLPIYDSWFAEKSARLVEALANAAVATRYIENPAVREFVIGKLHVALQQAENVINSQFHERPADFPPSRGGLAAQSPDVALPWLEELRSRSDSEKGRRRDPDEIVGAAIRRLEQRAMELGTPLALPEE